MGIDLQSFMMGAASGNGGIHPSGTLNISENGEYEVETYEKVDVQVEGGGGISGGYTVTFKVDGNDYYIASCEAGNSISEPPTPILEQGYKFRAWQINGTRITFPYIPNADVEIEALISQFDAIFLAHFDDSTTSEENITPTRSNNIAYYANGKFSQAVDVNGYLCYEIPNITDISTIECWFNTDGTDGVLFGFGEIENANKSCSGNIGVLKVKNGAIVYYGATGSPNNFNINQAFTVNTWHHFVYETSDNFTAVFLDGVKIYEAAQKGRIATNIVYLGSDGQRSGINIKGYIDEVTIYDTIKYTADFTPPTQPYV